VFVTLGIGVWLTWLATILALVSTSGIFPDMINSRSVDLLVAKPISRLRLFVLQYAAGLLFVTLQVTIFTLICFMVIGFRGGVWEPGLFMAIPLVVVFFSYLFSVCVFLGVLTRSTMAALLLTLLFWAAVYGVGTAETTLLMFVTMEQEDVDWLQMQHGNEDTEPTEPAPEEDTHSPDSAEQKKPKFGAAIGKSLLAAFVAEEEKPRQNGSKEKEADSGPSNLQIAQRIVYGMKTVLPKTTETMGLLERCLIDQAELPKPPDDPDDNRRPQQRIGRKVEETLRGRSVSWIVGTSLLFELVVLSMAAWVFCRRDY
jgi:hypothetical protein